MSQLEQQTADIKDIRWQRQNTVCWKCLTNDVANLAPFPQAIQMGEPHYCADVVKILYPSGPNLMEMRLQNPGIKLFLD